MAIVKNYKNFLRVNEGHREERAMDQLLDKMSKGPLSAEEQKLLNHLASGGMLPEEEKTEYKRNRVTGDMEFANDEEGGVALEQEPTKAGEEFLTNKGKQRSEQMEDSTLEARIYRNKGSDTRFIYIYLAEEHDWIVYRTLTIDRNKYPYGMFLDTDNPNFQFYKKTVPSDLWEELDWKYDFGMIMDDSLYEEFKTFMKLYEKGGKVDTTSLQRLYNKFSKIL